MGRRLALAASGLIYGSPDVPYSGPIVESADFFVDPLYGWSVRVTFHAKSCGAGLHVRAPQQCPSNGDCGRILLQYEYPPPRSNATSVTANVVVSGQYSIDFVPTTRMESRARNLLYCLGDHPMMTVYNSFGVPLVPFTLAF